MQSQGINTANQRIFPFEPFRPSADIAKNPLFLQKTQQSWYQKPLLKNILYPSQFEKTKDFWKAVTSNIPFNNPLGALLAGATKLRQQLSPNLTSDTSALDGDKELASKTQPLTAKGGRKHKSERDVQRATFVEVYEDEVYGKSKKSVVKMPLSKLQNVQDREKEEEQVTDKGNAPAGLNEIKSPIPRLPDFKDQNDPITRRHEDSYHMAKTSEPLKESKPTCNSVEEKKSVNHRSVTPSDENERQSFTTRAPLAPTPYRTKKVIYLWHLCAITKMKSVLTPFVGFDQAQDDACVPCKTSTSESISQAIGGSRR
jgi:hypothetical protein